MDLNSVSALAWVVSNKFVNENQKLIEFKDHRFLIDFYADESDDIVAKKSAQVGFSVAAIFKSFWDARYGGWNIIYALPTNNVVGDFVKPKVNPLISSNPAIQAIVKDDSVSYKRVGNRNLFFKGGFSDRDAISITGDILTIDEYDRMPDMGVVNTFDSRLQASSNPRRRRFSNPSQVGYGVDALYQDSNQLHWFIKCSHCNYKSFIDFDKDKDFMSHYLNVDKQIYACGKCDKEITDSDRRNGEWVAKYASRSRQGYWINQLMAPWVSAARILEQKNESSIDFFYNFVLGKAYTPSDLIVNREAILRANSPGIIPKVSVAMGVDQNVDSQIWVAMTAQGMFAHGVTRSWEDLERIKLMYNATMVLDPMPYGTHPKILAEKYNDVYLCRFKDMKDLSTVEWKGSIVYVDRTRGLDIVANEITEAKLLFRERPTELEDYIAEWQNIYRTTEEKDDGKVKSVWLKKDGKNSDYPFATLYARLALSQTLEGGMSHFVEPDEYSNTPITNEISKDGSTNDTLEEIVQDTLANLD